MAYIYNKVVQCEDVLVEKLEKKNHTFFVCLQFINS